MAPRWFRKRVQARRPGGGGSTSSFAWPGAARAAISFTFDDARPSAAERGAPVLERHGWRGTFFVLMTAVRANEQAWRAVADAGHEIGNHSQRHPCSGNFPWSRAQALEEYTLHRMAAELDAATAEIETFFGHRPSSFAYCCGQKFVGRGTETRSYVPLVADRFAVGRGFRDEHPNDPSFVDLAQVAAVEADGIGRRRFAELAEKAAAGGHWLVFVGHDVGRGATGQITIEREFDAFCAWLRSNGGFWVAPLADVAAHIAQTRSKG